MRGEAVVRGARSLWPPFMLLAGVGALGFFIEKLSSIFVSALAGLALSAAAYLFYRAMADFAPIDEQDAMRLLEAHAGLTESAPLTSSADRLVGGDGALWAWHRRRLEAVAGKLSKPVKPEVTRQDGLKLAVLILALSICLWQPVPAARALTFDLSPLMGDRDLVLDAWAQPPAYTGLPVVRLNRDTPNVSLPEGSIIFARMDGAAGAPRLRVGGQTIKMTRARNQAWTANATLTNSSYIKLDRYGTRAAWRITAIKDQAPQLKNSGPITIDARGRLEMSFIATDDYGISASFLRFKPRTKPEGLIGVNTFETPLIIEGEANEDGARRVFVDVSDHVLTGLEVDVSLVVRDGLGQETASKPTRLVMPQVNWKTTLGAALQEQRLLILREARPYQTRAPAYATLFDPQTGLPIRLNLDDSLSGAPQGIVRAQALLSATLASLKQTGLSDVGLMGMQFVRERLTLARHVDDAHDVAPLLWEMAMQAETSDQSPAQQKIAAAREALEQALKNGATEQELGELSQELREAVGERLDEMAQQNGEGQGGEGQGGEGQDGGGNSVSSGDIDSMLRELEQSGSSGARQDALDQLEKLGELMDNLQPGGGSAGESNQAGQKGSAGEMDEVMREQRDLSDETDTRTDQNGGAPAPDLADRQNELADRLSPLGNNSNDARGPEAQSQAGKAQAAQAMREAAEALRRGDLAGARDAQNRAEQALQQANQAQAGTSGSGGEKDPLGRSVQGRDDGKGTKVPDQVEKRRARDVREELRRRQADPNRDGQERDYLDRLLKDR